MCNGASDRARTGDPRFTRAVLYQLSYAGGHVMAQLRRQRLSMIRDIANPRKCSNEFSHGKCTNIEAVMSAVSAWRFTSCWAGLGYLARMGLEQNATAMAQPKILLTRIDDRFIYGQDVELWNEAIGTNLVLIANDEIAADALQWAPMRVATPDGVWTRFFSVQKTIDVIHTANPRQWILIMVASPADALELIKGGVPIIKVSVGHMRASEGRRPVTPAVAVGDADVAAFRELKDLDIELEIRYLPNSDPDPIDLVIGCGM